MDTEQQPKRPKTNSNSRQQEDKHHMQDFEDCVDLVHSISAEELYEEGMMWKEYYLKSVSYLKKSAAMKYPPAILQLHIINMEVKNENNPYRDQCKQYKEWFSQRAVSGNINNMFLYGLFLDKIENNKDDAVTWMKKAAEAYPPAQCALGVIYVNQGNVEEGRKWLRKASCSGYAEADFYYAISLRDTDSVTQMEIMERAANNGCTMAQLELAWYELDETEHGYQRAAYWYMRAAEKDHPDALICLSECYNTGHGVQLDCRESAELLQKAADMGHAGACMIIAEFCNDQCDESEEIYWLNKGVEYGSIPAMYQLGYHYLGDSNLQKCLELWTEAANKGHAVSQEQLGVLYLQGRRIQADYSQAVYWLKKAVDNENSTGLAELATCYRFGMGVPADSKKAVELYERGALLGMGSCQCVLGTLHYRGNLVKQDYEKAVYWFKKSAKEVPISNIWLGICYEYGDGVPQNHKKALKWIEKFRSLSDGDWPTILDRLNVVHKIDKNKKEESNEHWYD